MKRLLLLSLTITALHAQEETPKNSTATWTDIAKDFGYLTKRGCQRMAVAMLVPGYYFSAAVSRFIQKNTSIKPYDKIEMFNEQPSAEKPEVRYVNAYSHNNKFYQQVSASALLGGTINLLTYTNCNLLDHWPIVNKTEDGGDDAHYFENNKPFILAFIVGTGLCGGIQAHVDQIDRAARKFAKKHDPQYEPTNFINDVPAWHPLEYDYRKSLPRNLQHFHFTYLKGSIYAQNPAYQKYLTACQYAFASGEPHPKKS